MDIKDFPLLVLGMQNSGRSERGQAMDMSRLNTAITDFNDGMERGEIPNKSFVDGKEAVNRAIESAYGALFHNRLVGVPRDSIEHELYWLNKPQAHTITGFMKKVEKVIKGHDSEIGKSILDFCAQVKPLCDAVNDLKTKTVKRKPRSEEEKAAALYTPPISSTKSVALVQNLLEDIVNKAYDGLLKAIFEGNKKMLAGYLTAQEQVEAGTRKRDGFNQREKEKRFSYDPYEYFTYMQDGRRHVDSASAGLVSDCVERKEARELRSDESISYYDAIYIKKPDAEATLLAAAKKDADHIRQVYIVKNLKKIVSILEAKGDAAFQSAEEGPYGTSLGGLQGEIVFKFKDGSGFRISNDVVFVVNNYGTRFYRFPLTFHDVVLPGGKRMKGVSERSMNEVWAKAS